MRLAEERPTLEAVSRRKTRDIVAETLTGYITSQRLKPGGRLPTEQELADRFSVNRLSLSLAFDGERGGVGVV